MRITVDPEGSPGIIAQTVELPDVVARDLQTFLVALDWLRVFNASQSLLDARREAEAAQVAANRLSSAMLGVRLRADDLIARSSA